MYQRKLAFFSVCMLLTLLAAAQQKMAYRIFTAEGRPVSYASMFRKIRHAELIFFGELHNNAIAHWLEFELANDLSAKRRLCVGAEMFETDNQQALDNYLRGAISEKGFDSSVRLWKNYSTDYAPLVRLAKSKGISFIASNIPRRYATLVARGGFEALDTIGSQEKKWIAPLPILYDSTLPGYQAMLTMMQGHGGPHLPKAQALKDATMAWSILRNQQEGVLFLHFNGSYHSENHEGIVWYVRQSRPDMHIKTISVVTQTNPLRLEPAHYRKADFIICVDEDVTNTY